MTPKSDGPNQPIELPWLVMIANSLPPHVDAPDWGATWHSSRTQYWRLVRKAKQSLDRVGIDLEKIDAARFQRFMDENFPREQYAAFRDLIDGPDLGEMAVREQGLETISVRRSRLENYRFIVTTRRALREGAKLDAQIVARTRTAARDRGVRSRRVRRLYPLRICQFCELLFVVGRANQKVCDKKCGAALRQRRKRENERGSDRQDEYEVNRQRKMAAKELERKLKRKLKKGA